MKRAIVTLIMLMCSFGVAISGDWLDVTISAGSTIVADAVQLIFERGSAMAASQTHNLGDAGSTPAPATKIGE
jgi:hypothetical protein